MPTPVVVVVDASGWFRRCDVGLGCQEFEFSWECVCFRSFLFFSVAFPLCVLLLLGPGFRISFGFVPDVAYPNQFPAVRGVTMYPSQLAGARP